MPRGCAALNCPLLIHEARHAPAPAHHPADPRACRLQSQRHGGERVVRLDRDPRSRRGIRQHHRWRRDPAGLDRVFLGNPDYPDLNAAIAERYGIDRSDEGVLLLVTVRDATGNGIAPGDLQLQATAATLTEAARPLPLRAITTNGLTDYIGAFNTAAPATVQFRLSATRGGSRADIATTAELYPR